jgi:hypothetical protein
MTLPRLRVFTKYWRQFPPIRSVLASFVEIKPQESVTDLRLGLPPASLPTPVQGAIRPDTSLEAFMSMSKDLNGGIL